MWHRTIPNHSDAHPWCTGTMAGHPKPSDSATAYRATFQKRNPPSVANTRFPNQAASNGGRFPL